MTLFRFVRRLTRTAIFLTSIMAIWQAPAMAQGYGGRTATVSVSEASEAVLSNFTDIQGRVAAGQATAITATTNAVTVLEDFQLGDRIKAGQLIAVQDSTELKHRLSLLEAQRTEAGLRRDESLSAAAGDRDLLALLEAQLSLLEGKAQRAETLVARNALTVDAGETARNAVINVQQQIVQRRAGLVARDSQLALAEAALSRIAIEIRQVKSDIAATRITAPNDGQIISLSPAQRGYLREGDVLARTRSPQSYEIEAEIPLQYLRFVVRSESIEAADFSGRNIKLTPRVFLPIQNIRTGTQTVRLSVDGEMPRSLRAENAPVTLRVPTTSPSPVVTVPKDAVIPVSGGHVVFVASDGVAIQKRVRLGNATGDSFVVLNGLAAGEQVIVRGNEGLVDGRKIKIGDPGKRPAGPKGDKWTLTWTTRRGPAEGELILGKEKSFFNDEPVDVTRNGDDIAFIGKLVLPFGVIELDFKGTISGEEMAGKVTLSGFPSGNTPTLDFSGKKAGS